MEASESLYQDQNMRAVFNRDLFWSFYYSQGHEGIQHDLYAIAASIYRHNLSSEQQQNMLAAFASDLSVSNRLPAAHLPIEQSSGDVAATFTRLSQSFEATIHTRFARPPFHLVTKLEQSGRSIAEKTIERDQLYQRKERGMNKDVHASYFRKFVLLSEPTKSPTYDAAFKMIRESWRKQLVMDPDYRNVSVLSELGLLRTAWNDNHPNEAFDEGVDPALLTASF